jgi:hypothetical protein
MGMRKPYLLTLLLACVACSGPERMSGFNEHEARALARIESPADGCAWRNGRLVVEVQRVLVREYPHTSSRAMERPKQPLMLLWLRSARQPGRAPEVELVTLGAPEDFRDGDRIRVLEGKRLLERPLRSLSDRTLEFRLAENDRTLMPKWAEVSQWLIGRAGGAAGVIGESLPAEAVSKLLELLRQIDLDDQILVWSTSLSELVAQVQGPTRVVRVELKTPRMVKIASGETLPSAEVDLLAYIEPEPGCP